MIELDVRMDTRDLDGAIEAVVFLPDVIAEAGDDARDAIKPDLLRQLRQEPPVKRFPIGQFPWTSEKQRRFVLAKLRKDDNLPYQRSHRLSRSWDVRSRQSRNSYHLIIENPAPAAQYVYGKLDQRGRNAARRPQQRFHQIIGWPLAIDIINPEMERFEQRFEAFINERFEDRLGVSGRRRSRAA